MAVNDLGFRALRVVPWLWGLPPGHCLYYPLYAECVEPGIPFLTQALMSLLALNGLRVSEATSADIEHLGLERGHRTLVITRKGGNVVTILLAPRTARAIDLVTGERTEGPLFITADGADIFV